MGLTRTVPACSGYSELRTYGCRECGVWVTEGSTPRDQRPLGRYRAALPNTRIDRSEQREPLGDERRTRGHAEK